jgi:hypothetical protein
MLHLRGTMTAQVASFGVLPRLKILVSQQKNHRLWKIRGLNVIPAIRGHFARNNAWGSTKPSAGQAILE